MTEPSSHASLLAAAQKKLDVLAPVAEADPMRPRFHVSAPAGWINDPNGPIQFEGRYHLFMQFANDPRGGPKHWAHASSTNLAHWRHEPLALAPGPASYDSDGVYSGCCVDNHGTPTAIYTGVRPEVQCIATSDSTLKTWTKHPANPVIPTRPRDDLRGYRDPFVWREDHEWRMLLGSGIGDVGGTVLLYRSADLLEWEYLGELCTGFGFNWECPAFFPLGNEGKWVLIVSPHDHVRYAVGDYDGRRFIPGPWHRWDLGPFHQAYAPNGLLDQHGRRIFWSWIHTGVRDGQSWTGVLSLPRVLTLASDLTLRYDLPEELAMLRKEGAAITDERLQPGDQLDLKVDSDCVEVDLTVNCAPGTIGLWLGLPISIDLQRGLITIGRESYEFALRDDEQQLRVRAFRDRSVLELFLNGRACLTRVLIPALWDVHEPSNRICLFAHEAPVVIQSVYAWPISSIWTN